MTASKVQSTTLATQGEADKLPASCTCSVGCEVHCGVHQSLHCMCNMQQALSLSVVVLQMLRQCDCCNSSETLNTTYSDTAAG
jgi:hypothetical protein